MALEHVARLLRTAGAAGKPALWKGEPQSADLCGLSWAGRVVRGSVRVEQGSLVLGRFQASGGGGNCPGDDLPAPVRLVPGFTFVEVRFRYVTPAGEVTQCSPTSSPPCTKVTGVVVSVVPEGAPAATELFVALRNPGGP